MRTRVLAAVTATLAALSVPLYPRISAMQTAARDAATLRIIVLESEDEARHAWDSHARRM